MSAAASWSYTATATLWAQRSRDDFSGALIFDAPVTFDCDYSSKAQRATNAAGVEFTTGLTLYTERADIRQGDRVMIGASTATDPIAAGALEVRAVSRDADTFDRSADDYRVMT